MKLTRMILIVGLAFFSCFIYECLLLKIRVFRMSQPLGIIIVLFITILLCRYSYYLGFKAGAREKEQVPYHNYPPFYKIEK